MSGTTLHRLPDVTADDRAKLVDGAKQDLDTTLRAGAETVIGDDRAGILLAPLFLLNGDLELEDGAADEDELLAEASGIIPTCIVGAHEFWRSYGSRTAGERKSVGAGQ